MCVDDGSSSSSVKVYIVTDIYHRFEEESPMLNKYRSHLYISSLEFNVISFFSTLTSDDLRNGTKLVTIR